MKILRFREINRDIFEAIKNGTKSVETRAASPKFSGVKAGDVLVFKCGKDKFEKTVKKAKLFKGVKEILKDYRIKQINPYFHSADELEKMYKSFPGYVQKIKKYGLIAIEFGE
jgi:ASC-1-like (ASCH) protein